MITLILILISGFIWITRDIIRVPETMGDSWFKKYVGNRFVDPQVSWVNKGNPHILKYVVLSMYADLFHLLGTAYLFILLWAVYLYSWGLPFILFVFLGFLFHGGGVWLGYNLWRKILNPKISTV